MSVSRGGVPPNTTGEVKQNIAQESGLKGTFLKVQGLGETV